MRKKTLAIVCLLALGAGAGSGGENTIRAEDVLARYVEALGGRAALDSLTMRVCEGRFIDDRPYRGPRTETPVEVRVAAGRAAVITEDGIAREDGPDTVGERSKLSWLLDPRGALTVAENFPGLRYDGEVPVRGAPAHRLVSDRDPDHYALYFDVETGLLLRIGHYWNVSDWRGTDGTLAPHRIECSRKGGVNVWIFDKMEAD